jgi:hypothetical protein
MGKREGTGNGRGKGRKGRRRRRRKRRRIGEVQNSPGLRDSRL